jgi:hypothetical protein
MHRAVQLTGSFGCGCDVGALTSISSPARSIIKWCWNIVETSEITGRDVFGKRNGLQEENQYIWKEKKKIG